MADFPTKVDSLADPTEANFVRRREVKHTEGGLQVTWEPLAEQEIRRRSTSSLPSIGNNNGKSPYMVALVGIPGSGKSTCAGILADYLHDVGTIVFSHDGYHYTLDTLRKLPDAKEAEYRRGAPDTFDAESLHRDLHRIRFGREEIVKLPGFDHAVGDPEQNAHVFCRAQHNIVICEGLYLLHDDHGWDKVSDCFDMTIFLDADLDKCMDRLKIRNQAIPGYTPEEIVTRVNKIDRSNALTVVKCRERATLVYKSVAS